MLNLVLVTRSLPHTIFVPLSIGESRSVRIQIQKFKINIMLLPLFLLSSIFSFCCAFENYEIVDSDGNVHTYSEYIKKNQFLLIVNVASECGFTDQYFGLEEMYLEMQENDIELEILAFPCNQFGGQEPMEYGHQIQTFVQDTFEVTFPIMDKVNDVFCMILIMYNINIFYNRLK